MDDFIILSSHIWGRSRMTSLWLRIGKMMPTNPPLGISITICLLSVKIKYNFKNSSGKGAYSEGGGDKSNFMAIHDEPMLKICKYAPVTTVTA